MLIAVLPMGIAYAKGVPFQGSIGWAVNVINGTDTAEGRTSQAEQILEQAQTSSEQTSKEQTSSGERMTESGETTEAAVQPTEQSNGGNGQTPDGGSADAGKNSAPKQSAGNHMLAMAERMAASSPARHNWSGNTGMCSCTVKTGRNGLCFLAVWH